MQVQQSTNDFLNNPCITGVCWEAELEVHHSVSGNCARWAVHSRELEVIWDTSSDAGDLPDMILTQHEALQNSLFLYILIPHVNAAVIYGFDLLYIPDEWRSISRDCRDRGRRGRYSQRARENASMLDMSYPEF